MKKDTIIEGWLTEGVAPLNYHLAKFKNWMAVVNGYKEDGKENREYLKDSDNEDVYFFFGNKVKKDMVIAVGCYDKYKPQRSQRCYYKVLDINEECVILSDAQTTYLKAKKYTEEVSTDTDK